MNISLPSLGLLGIMILLTSLNLSCGEHLNAVLSGIHLQNHWLCIHLILQKIAEQLTEYLFSFIFPLAVYKKSYTTEFAPTLCMVF